MRIHTALSHTNSNNIFHLLHLRFKTIFMNKINKNYCLTHMLGSIWKIHKINWCQACYCCFGIIVIPILFIVDCGCCSKCYCKRMSCFACLSFFHLPSYILIQHSTGIRCTNTNMPKCSMTIPKPRFIYLHYILKQF